MFPGSCQGVLFTFMVFAGGISAAGASINTKGREDRTALTEAVLRGNPKLVKLLLARGANPHLKDRTGKTAWTWAAAQGRPEIIQCLKEAAGPTQRPDQHAILPE